MTIGAAFQSRRLSSGQGRLLGQVGGERLERLGVVAVLVAAAADLEGAAGLLDKMRSSMGGS